MLVPNDPYQLNERISDCWISRNKQSFPTLKDKFDDLVQLPCNRILRVVKAVQIPPYESTDCLEHVGSTSPISRLRLKGGHELKPLSGKLICRRHAKQNGLQWKHVRPVIRFRQHLCDLRLDDSQYLLPLWHI